MTSLMSARNMILTRFVMTPTLRRLGNRKSYQLSALLSVFAWGGISQSWRPGSLAARSVSYVGSDSLFAVVEGGIPLETMLVKQGTEATDAVRPHSGARDLLPLLTLMLALWLRAWGN